MSDIWEDACNVERMPTSLSYTIWPTSMKNRPHGALFVAVEQIAFPKSFKVSFIFYNSYYYNLSRLKILNELY